MQSEEPSLDQRQQDALVDALQDLPHVNLRRNEPMHRHTPLRLGGPADLWCVTDTAAALLTVLKQARTHGVRWRVHWPFEDWLVRDGGIPGLVIRPGREFEALERTGEGVRVGAATPWASLDERRWGVLHGWAGTPGTLFSLGEQERLARLCSRLRWIRANRVETVEIEPGQPVPVVPASAILLDLELRYEPRIRPVRERNPYPRLGTFYANARQTDAIAELARANLHGTRLYAWRFSAVEPGTLVNRGGGSLAELMMLNKGVCERLEKHRGLTLEPRLPLVGVTTRTSRRRP